MIGRIARWVVGAVSFVASVIAIDRYVRDLGPAEVFGSVEVHPSGWGLIAAVLAGVFGALVAQPLFEWWVFEPRRTRVKRFQALHSGVLNIRTLQQARADSEDLSFAYEAIAPGLRALGVDLQQAIQDGPTLLDMMERGALGEARQRFPAGRGQRRAAATSPRVRIDRLASGKETARMNLELALCQKILDAAEKHLLAPIVMLEEEYADDQIEHHIGELQRQGYLTESTTPGLTLLGQALLDSLRSKEEVRELRRAIGALVACLLQVAGAPIVGEAEQLGLRSRAIRISRDRRFPPKAAEILTRYRDEADDARQ